MSGSEGLNSTAAMAPSISGGLSSIGSAWASARAAQMQSDYQANAAEMNAKLAEIQAADALKRGDKEATKLRKDVKSVIGAQKTAYAASGINVDSGSALEVQEDTAVSAKLDSLTIKNNAFREAMGYKTEALSSASQASYARMAGKMESTSSLLTGGINALSYGAKGLMEYRKGK